MNGKFDNRSDIAEEINNRLIEQLMEADMNNMENIDLHVPEILDWEDWEGQRISNVLFSQGIISRNITVTVVNDSNMNWR